MSDVGVTLEDLLAGSPHNWGRWGPNDEVGCLNFLGPLEVLGGTRSVKQGKTFTLQTAMCQPGGDPISPERQPATRLMARDRGSYISHKLAPVPGGLEYADDLLFTYLHGTTHCDALGHVWHDNVIWNGRDATTTIDGLSFASILPIASKGIVGRGLLLDIARFQSKEALDRGQTLSHNDLLACATGQGSPIRKHDILLLRTGWIGLHEKVGHSEWVRDFREPGLTYSRELVDWFHSMEIACLVTDTISNEVLIDPVSRVQCPLHIALIAKLGIVFLEAASLDDLASDCAADLQYDFLFSSAPLKVVGGSGAPINPVVIK